MMRTIAPGVATYHGSSRSPGRFHCAGSNQSRWDMATSVRAATI